MGNPREETLNMQAAQHYQATADRILQLAFGYAPPLVIHAAIANGVFDALETGPRSVDGISAATGTPALWRVNHTRTTVN
jgi:hypothetical protein